jgi:serine/threonine-protein kinase
VSVALVAGAVGAKVALLSGHRDVDGGQAPTTPPPPAISARMDLPVVVIGADCAVLGAAAVDETGTAAYCARADSQSQETVWSPQPERLRVAPTAAPPVP